MRSKTDRSLELLPAVARAIRFNSIRGFCVLYTRMVVVDGLRRKLETKDL